MFLGGKEKEGGEGKGDTGDGSVDPEDPHEWSVETVDSFVRVNGTC